ncbi:MAG: hypothetical protein RJA44_156, partial [Pseudomonadota bacterium]
MTRRIFISYSHEDHIEAQQCHRAVDMMCASLDGDSAIFLDAAGAQRLRAGDDWDARIRAELERADVYLVLMSSAYFASAFCRDIELCRILERQRDQPGLLVIGIALHDLNPRSFYTDKLGRELSMQQFQCLPQGRIEAPAGGTKLGLKPIS